MALTVGEDDMIQHSMASVMSCMVMDSKHIFFGKNYSIKPFIF